MQNYCQKLYEVQIFGAEKIKVTDEHPFYIREMKKSGIKIVENIFGNFPNLNGFLLRI